MNSTSLLSNNKKCGAEEEIFLLTYLTLTPLTDAITHSDLENLGLILSRIKIVWPLIRPVLTYEAKLLSTSPQK